MDREQQQPLIQTGITGSLEAVEKRTEAEEEEMRDGGSFPFVKKTAEQMINIIASQQAVFKKVRETFIHFLCLSHLTRDGSRYTMGGMIQIDTNSRLLTDIDDKEK